MEFRESLSDSVNSNEMQAENTFRRRPLLLPRPCLSLSCSMPFLLMKKKERNYFVAIIASSNNKSAAFAKRNIKSLSEFERKKVFFSAKFAYFLSAFLEAFGQVKAMKS